MGRNGRKLVETEYGPSELTEAAEHISRGIEEWTRKAF